VELLISSIHYTLSTIHLCFEPYRFDGFLRPDEFAARTLCGYAMAYLHLKPFDVAESIYVDVLKRWSTSYAAPKRNTKDLGRLERHPAIATPSYVCSAGSK